jgi:hypothetical protein
MAVVSVLSYSIVDDDGNAKSMPIYIPAGATVANIQAFSDAMAPLLDDVLDGVINAVTLSIGLTLPGGLKSSPVAGSNVQEGALISFDVASSNYSHSIFVPAWAQAFFSGSQVTLEDTEPGLFATQMVSGSNTIAPSDRAGLDLTSVLSGSKRFRK